MKKLATALTASALLFQTAWAQSNLSPDTSALFAEPSGYVANIVDPLVSVLKDAYTGDVRVRAIVIPAIRAQYAAGIKQEAKGYFVFVLGTSLPFARKAAITAKCEKPIASEDASRMIDVWKRMLVKTSYRQAVKKKQTILDGADYHFSLPSYPPTNGGAPMPTLYDAMEGHTFNPDSDSEPGMMVGIVDSLKDYCVANNKASLLRANTLATELLNRLKAD